MDAQTLARVLDREPFLPVRFGLVDGTNVDVPVPYLSFVHGRFLHAACAVSPRHPDGGGVAWIPLEEIASVERLK